MLSPSKREVSAPAFNFRRVQRPARGSEISEAGPIRTPEILRRVVGDAWRSSIDQSDCRVKSTEYNPWCGNGVNWTVWYGQKVLPRSPNDYWQASRREVHALCETLGGSFYWLIWRQPIHGRKIPCKWLAEKGQSFFGIRLVLRWRLCEREPINLMRHFIFIFLINQNTQLTEICGVWVKEKGLYSTWLPGKSSIGNESYIVLCRSNTIFMISVQIPSLGLYHPCLVKLQGEWDEWALGGHVRRLARC